MLNFANMRQVPFIIGVSPVGIPGCHQRYPVLFDEPDRFSQTFGEQCAKTARANNQEALLKMTVAL
jgi:hypothetical protein